MSCSTPLLFSLQSGVPLLRQVTGLLDVAPAPSEEREFEDGEFKIRPLVSVDHRTAVIIQPLCAADGLSVNDVLLRVFCLLGALRDAGAVRLHLVAPYLCYARKDRRTKSRDPLSLRYLAQLFEAMHLDSLSVAEAHNPAAFENAFRIPTAYLDTTQVLLDCLASRFAAPLAQGKLTIATPDIGGAKRAEELRRRLAERVHVEPSSALLYKRRSEGIVSGDLVAGDVAGQTVVLVDDMIVSGTTLVRAAKKMKQQGAESVYAAAVHGVFPHGAAEKLAASDLAGLFVTDTLPSLRDRIEALGDRIEVLPIAPSIARRIRSSLMQA